MTSRTTVTDGLTDNLNICHVNCQSLLAHFDEFCYYFSTKKYIICMSKTWHRQEVPDTMAHLPGYTLFRCDRVGKHGGGVAFYLIDSLNAIILKHSDGGYGRPEFIIASIEIDNASNLLLAVVYRPPHIGYLQEFFHVFLELQEGYQHSIIFGDLNADMLQHTYDSELIGQFVASSYLHLVPYQSTHNLINSSTWLDVCIVDDSSKILSSGQCGVAFLSAHGLIYIKYNIKICRRLSRTIKCRDYTKLNEEAFFQDIENIDWSELYSSNSIDAKTEIFASHLLDCLDLHAPLRQRRFKNLPAPWLSNEIKTEMRARDLARRAWNKRRNDVSLHKTFKTLRNRVQSHVRAAKRTYYLDIFRRAESTGVVWSKLRHLGLVKARGANLNFTHSVEELNNFFAGGHRENAETVIDEIVEDRTMAFDDSLFYWSYVTPLVIHRALLRMKSNAIGVDGISLKLIRLVEPYIMPVIEHLFNFSLTSGTFPTAWKSALICPIPKIKSPTQLQHYRPISLLPTLSKIMERIVSDQIQSYLQGT